MNVKTFNHNGGVWTRPDIPCASQHTWKCFVCQKEIDSEQEQWHTQTGEVKVRFIPASRYWHGQQVNVEYCSIECSFIDFQQQCKQDP